MKMCMHACLFFLYKFVKRADLRYLDSPGGNCCTCGAVLQIYISIMRADISKQMRGIVLGILPQNAVGQDFVFCRL